MSCILLVDDLPEVRRVVARVLERAGYSVITAAGGAEALAILERESVDALLIDLHMPSMSGRTLHHRVVARWPDLADHTAVMTGDSGDEEDADWIKANGVPVLRKPFEMRNLLALVQSFVEKRAPRRADSGGH